jgi:hypothetical protein
VATVTGSEAVDILQGGLKMSRVRGFLLTLLLLSATGPARGDFITNGGFETGDFTGWTLSSGTAVVSGAAAHTGNFGAMLTTSGAEGSLSQTVTTPTGSPLTLTFFLASDGVTPNHFQVSFGGKQLLNLPNIPQQNFTEYQFSVTPSSASNLLQFKFHDDKGSLSLDDVSLTGAHIDTAPEPGSLALLGIGGVFLGGFARRRPRLLRA